VSKLCTEDIYYHQPEMKRIEATGEEPTLVDSLQEKAARSKQNKFSPTEEIRTLNSLYGPFPSWLWLLPNFVPCVWPGAARVRSTHVYVRASGGRTEQREKPPGAL